MTHFLHQLLHRRRFAALVLSFAFSAGAFAQEEAPPPPPPPGTSTLSVRVRVAAVNAVVRGRDGKLMNDLTKQDFEVREDGKRQAIRYFSHDDQLPIFIGLMVDTSGSERQYFTEVRHASNVFLRAMITRPKDKATTIRFDTDVRVMQRTTPDVSKLEQSLGHLTDHHAAAANPHAGTLLYDAICATTHSSLPSGEGRRAIVIITDGDDNGSVDSLDTAIACAQFADISVYSVLYTDTPYIPSLLDNPITPLPTTGKRLPGPTAMARISNATGGHAFNVSKSMPIERIFAQIEDEMRTQYRLGFTPRQAKPRSYHSLELKTNQKGAMVQSRIGYYTPEQ